nr:GAF domain-containing sensor histidine kinase [Ancylothrix sp. D3o]
MARQDHFPDPAFVILIKRNLIHRLLAEEKKKVSREDCLSALALQNYRLGQPLEDNGYLEGQPCPAFEQASKAAAEFLEIPIAIVGWLDQNRVWVLAAEGLPHLMPIKRGSGTVYLSCDESLCKTVIENRQVVAIRDTAAYPDLAQVALVQEVGIRAYLGVPLLSSTGKCLGTLAVMDLAPRYFSSKEIQFLEMTARLCMSEFERLSLLASMPVPEVASAMVLGPEIRLGAASNPNEGFKSIKTQMITRVTEALRTPLTSVLGMASVLNRGIYGSLTNKQQEYLGIIHDSGKYLLSLVDEVLALMELDDSGEALHQSPLDVEMLCSKVINSLEQDLNRREQEIRLTVEPGNRIWVLDKLKVQQLLYNLIFCVIESSSAGSIVRIHVSRKMQRLHLTVWVSHPWLGEGLPLAALSSCSLNDRVVGPALLDESETKVLSEGEYRLPMGGMGNGVAVEEVVNSEKLESHRHSTIANQGRSAFHRSRESLGLLLSCLLAELHRGEISVQGSPEAGYRYVVSLPELG